MAPPELKRLIETIPLKEAELAKRLGRCERTIARWRTGKSRPSRAEVELLQRLSAQFARPGDGRPDFRFVDLFAGIGGFRLAVEAVGGRCVLSCERDRFCRKTYQANFADPPEHPFPDDITKLDVEDVPHHDLLVAGFPCQPFSIAGVSKKNALGRPHGFSCLEQGNLFFRIADILAHRRPAAFILENVKNLRSHDRGRTFRTILETLQDTLGYHVSAQVLDARSVVPQHRERIFIVGFREDVGFSFDNLKLPPADSGPRLGAILHPEDGSEEPEWPYTEGPRARVTSRYTLSDHLWNYLQAYAEKHRAKGNGFGFGLVGSADVARTLSARYFKDGSEILVRRRRGNPRRLTPRECARLMGFDWEGRRFRIPVSDTQAYRQFGNAVVVPVAQAVAAAVVPPMMRLIAGEQPGLPFFLPSAASA
jgi:DNA (cytosine-5)-methyltransferase 1